MEYVTLGNRRLELPNAVVAAGGPAVEAYVANPPKDARYIDALPPDPATSQDDALTPTDDED